MTDPDRTAPEEVMWAGRFITAKRRGKWEYVGRARGIHAAVILAIDEAEDGRHVLLVDQYRFDLAAQGIMAACKSAIQERLALMPAS